MLGEHTWEPAGHGWITELSRVAGVTRVSTEAAQQIMEFAETSNLFCSKTQEHQVALSSLHCRHCLIAQTLPCCLQLCFSIVSCCIGRCEHAIDRRLCLLFWKTNIDNWIICQVKLCEWQSTSLKAYCRCRGWRTGISPHCFCLFVQT